MNNTPKLRSIILIVIALLLSIISAAHSPRDLDAVSLAQVATPTVSLGDVPAEPVDIGSTDGITIWGTILVIVFLVAVVWHWPDWSKPKLKPPQ